MTKFQLDDAQFTWVTKFLSGNQKPSKMADAKENQVTELGAKVDAAFKGGKTGKDTLKDVLGLIGGSDALAAVELVKQVLHTETNVTFDGILSRKGQFKQLNMKQNSEHEEYIDTPDNRKESAEALIASIPEELRGLMDDAIRRLFRRSIKAEKVVLELACTAPKGSLTYVGLSLLNNGEGSNTLTHTFAIAQVSFELAPDLLIKTVTKKSFLSSSSKQEMVELPPTIGAEHMIALATFLTHSRSLLGLQLDAIQAPRIT